MTPSTEANFESVRIADLAEYPGEKSVRKRVFLSDKAVSEVVFCEKGGVTAEHHHPRQDEVFLVLEGTGIIMVGEREVRVEPTSMVFVPANEKHSVVVDDDCRMTLVFFKGPGRPSKTRTKRFLILNC